MNERPKVSHKSLRAGFVLGALLVGMTTHAAMADALFIFDEQATLNDSMTALGNILAENVDPQGPCRLDVINDLRGETLFDTATLELMNETLAASILGTEKVDDCVIETHEISQEDATVFLIEQRGAGEAGLAAVLTYYRINKGLTVLATLRDEKGRLAGSTQGLFELPAKLAASEQTTVSAQPKRVAESTPEASAASVTDVAEAKAPEPAAETRRQSVVVDLAQTEASLRQEALQKARITTSLTAPFNLRRIQAGIPSSIKTVRVADTGGLDADMMADLAEDFLDDLASSPTASVEASDYGSNGRAGIEVTVKDAPQVGAVDIQTSDSEAAFAEMLDNEIDIVVTREPISADDSARFVETFGVNMRSHYAEHVVAIGTGEVELLSCGIDYPRDEIMMTTEDHPTSQRIYLYTNPSVPDEIRDRFVDFALSPKGQSAVANHTFDLRLHLSGARYATWRDQAAGELEPALPSVLARFRSLIRTSERVSTTFRFDFASADLVLDSRSEQDLENLIDLIKTKGVDSRRVLLFGFADSVGAARFNADLSRERADAVATRLRLAGIPVPPTNVYGVGEDSPVACDVTPEGDRNELGALKNRRVEVWIES
ncbi:MAG: phosphate ABC transporter substrate-binding/OmpA family protein [Pseudomonadota bacterium]